MTPWAAIALLVAAILTPLLLSRRIERHGSPRQLLIFSLGTLAALALGLLVTLATVVDDAALPTGDVPALVGRCVRAASGLLQQPLAHWPQIIAAVVLVLVVGRVVFAGLVIARASQLQVRSVVRIVGQAAWRRGGAPLVLPVPSQVAFTVGLVRPRIVISEGLVRRLSAAELRAVIEHERRHVTGGHLWLLYASKVLERGFAFLPTIRVVARLLATALELDADQSAVRGVGGDRSTVVRALIAVLPGSDVAVGAASLGVAKVAVATRIRRLVGPPEVRPRQRIAVGVAVSAAILLALLSAVALPLSDALGRPRSTSDHAMCHLGADPSIAGPRVSVPA